MDEIPKRAFITGVYGQDGSYLAEHLLALGYIVRGLICKEDSVPIGFDLNSQKFSICVGDFGDINSYAHALSEFAPDEIYNLAAISDLKTAKEFPEYTYRINCTAFEDLISYSVEHNKEVKVFQALSSRILIPDPHGVITERSPLSEPQNAYDRAKRDSYEKVVQKYREKGYFVASGFLCNHESPRRGERFVTGKIAKTAVTITRGVEEVLEVGNVFSKRDWSFAWDVVEAIHLTLQTKEAYNYVIGSGELHTVKEFIDCAFGAVGMNIVWKGEGKDMQGYDKDGTVRVVVNSAFYQPDDNSVVANNEFTTEKTGWTPKTSFRNLVKMMVEAELQKVH